ncbi:uncharacterized protein A1O9_06062 [Exophiala aquamarina CBS 119918]|uniref:Uncharacterized protein n=1 Tax=Exophiala aquamarina CBS 119918 TaxID=1182545 RepID=A0A072PFT4_9EURO|nr:uncharacterized protein A1O9_06062 [Exophiala aquamarina CBS 119918]KEF58138.1 hypothetical protein A1O9_06062 [Exophiala aquamarina CBS 119918]
MEHASQRPTEGFLIPPRVDESRNSIISSMSRFWRTRPAPESSGASQGRPTKTFVVPLFLSASRSSGRNNLFARGALPAATRSRTSTRSVIDNEVPRTMAVRSIHDPRPEQWEQSDLYGSGSQPGTVDSSVTAPHSVTSTTNESTSASGSSRTQTTSSRSGSRGSRSTQNSRRTARSRQILSTRAYRDPKVNSKAKICFAFGVTLVVAVVIYLVLAVTGVAGNTAFHVLSILFILSLTGIFCHQLIRMFILIKAPRRTRRRAAHGRRHGGTSHRTKRHGGTADDIPPEKPIQIHMSNDDGFGADVEMIGDAPVQYPPPVYGNFRTSTRMNPDFVHWKHVPPSPLTPTYDEALNHVLPTTTYRPPSYLSESGMTQVLENQSRDVDAALEHIHPLERERMRNMAADALEGRGPN